MIYQSYFVGENTSVLTIYSNLSLSNENLNEFSQKIGENGLFSHKKICKSFAKIYNFDIKQLGKHIPAS
jgi:hypothetical protein